MGGPFTLTDQDGRRVSDRDFAGKYRLVYFGYTFCPDVCPTDLQMIGAGLRRFEASDPAAPRGSSRSSSPSIPRATRRPCCANMSPPSTRG
jgi:peroxiredoxin